MELGIKMDGNTSAEESRPAHGFWLELKVQFNKIEIDLKLSSRAKTFSIMLIQLYQ